MNEREGPERRIVFRCTGCIHHHVVEHYLNNHLCEDYCCYLFFPPRSKMGEYAPNWCPYRHEGDDDISR
jgi:hypothetical protein